MGVVIRPARPAWRPFVETVLGAIALALFIMAFVARAFTVDGPSMFPTLSSGERLLVEKLTYRLRDPVRGEIVVFKPPSDPSHYLVKRVIGEPGDTVEIRNGRIVVNGVVLDEPYARARIYGRSAVYQVPEGHYFVLGDNRNNSQDSRSPRVGFIPRRAIVGRAVVRYWPLDRVTLFRTPGLATSWE